MDSRTVKIKISRSELVALNDVYLSITTYAQPHDDHMRILLEHAYELRPNLQSLLGNWQAKYTLKLRGVAALAFLQLWQRQPLVAGSLEQVTVARVIEAIDQRSKAPKHLGHVVY